MTSNDRLIPSNKSFGIFFGLIFLFLSLFLFFFHFQNFYIFIVLSLLFISLSFICPKLLFPLNITWYYVGFALSKIISPIILALIYFLLISPFSFLAKIFKKQFLDANFSNDSSWQQRSQKSVNLKKQY